MDLVLDYSNNCCFQGQEWTFSLSSFQVYHQEMADKMVNTKL